MLRRKIFLVSAGLFAGSLFISCNKYLDVNKNPNILQSSTVDALLPSGEMYIASSLGVDLQITGSIWGQYWTQNPNSSQYRVLEQYVPTASQFENPWTNLYRGAENLYQVSSLAIAQNKKQYHAISLLLRAYTFQLVTDAWGDVPYSEALKGQAKDGGIVNPHYDAQKNVYTGILTLIDSANKLINNSDPTKPGSDDLIYSGDMDKWQVFSNTLKLKVLLRLAEKDPATAQAGIAALYATGHVFIDEGGDAMINFKNTAGNKNPLYAEVWGGLQGVQNLVGSKTCIDSLNANDDYRGFIFYEYVPSKGVPVGIQQGDYSAIVAPGSFSIPSAYIGANFGKTESASAPVKFISAYESYFLQAEAVARGWVSGDDADLFKKGIHASFFSYSASFNDLNLDLADPGFVTPSGDTLQSTIYLTADFAYYSYLNGDTLYGAPAAYWGMYPASGSLAEKLRYIITQKWFSMCGNQGFEAWSEWRRTGYPDFFAISVNSLIGNQFPQRLIYPNSEITTNLNFIGLQPVTANVWWDIH